MEWNGDWIHQTCDQPHGKGIERVASPSKSSRIEGFFDVIEMAGPQVLVHGVFLSGRFLMCAVGRSAGLSPRWFFIGTAQFEADVGARRHSPRTQYAYVRVVSVVVLSEYPYLVRCYFLLRYMDGVSPDSGGFTLWI